MFSSDTKIPTYGVFHSVENVTRMLSVPYINTLMTDRIILIVILAWNPLFDYLFQLCGCTSSWQRLTFKSSMVGIDQKPHMLHLDNGWPPVDPRSQFTGMRHETMHMFALINKVNDLIVLNICKSPMHHGCSCVEQNMHL